MKPTHTAITGFLALTITVFLAACSSDSGSDSQTGASDDDTELNPIEAFSVDDQPEAFTHESLTFSSPWGYKREGNKNRVYPLVVAGCWGEGVGQYAAVDERYPAFVLDYQKNGVSDGESLADWIGSAIAGGYRIDANRVYLTGFSMGGSGSFPLARGMRNRDAYFAAIVRVAGQSESDLGEEIAEKTAVWYHIGLNDTETRVAVARAALELFRGYDCYESASESMKDDDITGYARTTVTLTRSGKPMFKYSEYAGMGHDPSPCYRDESLFPWMFSHTLAPR